MFAHVKHNDLCMILALYYTVRIILHPTCYANDFSGYVW
ncbi:hypothetical protein Xkoz_01183 [Xenorhabdus kozodoii]|uniref:Uncharacterized protein n=1 Tax=Xenorhabdus kozodoii TaxID=351676 RepID=A0A2D0LE65_9GAMM|nr:hypothetical protein Xkoz_01183 [Xenorhabdus kozodoii]